MAPWCFLLLGVESRTEFDGLQEGADMDSGMINKIVKARRYAEERDRIVFDSFQVTLRGNHNDHRVTYQAGTWLCDCDFFAQRGVCSHTMALERLLSEMVEASPQAVEEGA